MSNNEAIVYNARPYTVPIDPKYIPVITQKSLDELKKVGWNKPYELSEEGFLVSPSSYELVEFWNEKRNKEKKAELDKLRNQGLLPKIGGRK